jgi:hypothetical protein
MISWDFAGFQPYVVLAAGTYLGGCWLTGQPVGAHAVNIVGQQSADKEESCTQSQAEQVVVRGLSGEAIFDFQDLAIGILRCLTLEGPESMGVHCRQTPASDVAFVKFGGQQALSVGIAANESCGVNLGGIIWVGNNMSSLLNANLSSRLTVAAPIIAVKQVNIDYIVLSYQMSIVELQAKFFHVRRADPN